MPQMAPISWMILFIVFSLSFVIFNMINFYNKNFFKTMEINKNNMTMNNKNNFINWKW